ncbi:MAG: BolA/IbaG family iron-sulfur metabolism protein [Kofleriaceae bacterium]
MSDHPTDFVGSIPEAITAGIRARLADAVVEVSGGGGHYTIDVVSTGFADLGLLARQRLVLSAIAHLINGERAPVHAVDKLTTRTP